MKEYERGDIVKLKDGRSVRILETFYKGEKPRAYEAREIDTDPYTTSTEEILPRGIRKLEKRP